MNDTITTTSTDRVWRRMEEPLSLFGNPVPSWAWFVVLGVVLGIGLLYIILMYRRDARSIGLWWASFLGLLRAGVYLLLCAVFLMPAEQTWHDVVQRSKVVMMYDVSLSMSKTRDDVPGQGQKYDDMKTRTAKLMSLLGDDRIRFVGRLEEKNPITAYRFSRGLDNESLLFDRNHEKALRFWPRSEREKYQAVRSREDREKIQNDFPGYVIDEKHWDRWLTSEIDERLPAGWKADELRAREYIRQAKANDEKVKARFFHASAIGESLLEVIKQERNNHVQGIVLFTDGRLTEGSLSTVQEASKAAADAGIPIFVVQVGEARQKVMLDIVDIGVPPLIRPEDKFRVVVAVNGHDVTPNDPFDIFLDVSRIVRDKEGKITEKTIELVTLDSKGNLTDAKPIPLKPKITLPKTFAKEAPVFKQGNPPTCQVEYELDAATMARAAGVTLEPNLKVGIAPDDDSELRFVARVPKDKREITEKAEHVSETADMRVQKKPLRVLVFTNAATRDYQFLRTLLVREMDKQRAEICIHIQKVPGGEARQGIVQDIDASRMLNDFPRKSRLNKGDMEPYYALPSYDVVVAIDPNWDDLGPEQIKLLSDWVYKDGGGLILVGDKLNTQELASPLNAKEGTKYRPLLDMLPVVLEFSQKEEVKTDTPQRLEFPQVTPDMEWMRLDEIDSKTDWKKGWDRFFNEIQDEDGKVEMKPESAEPERGIFSYYPVRAVKPNATRLATIDAPTALLPGGKGEKQPWLAMGPWGAGKVVWMGSGETWRLRMYREAYHERFWTKLLREVGSGSVNTMNKRISPIMSRYGSVNKFQPFEARFEDINGEPLRNTTKPPPKLIITLPEGVQAQAKDRVLLKDGEYAGKRGTVLEVITDRDAGGAELRKLRVGNIEGVENKKQEVVVLATKVDVLAEDIAFKPRLGEKPELNEKNDGWFKVEFQPKAVGEYKLKVAYEDSPDNVYNHKFVVKDSNPELDNVKPDVEVLWELASTAGPVLSRIKDADVKQRLEGMLKRPEGLARKDGEKAPDVPGQERKADDSLRLLFTLQNASIIPDCMDRREKTVRNRGKIDDLWDDGFFNTENEHGEKKPLLPYVLCIAVGLLSVEWLTRKLLRLA